MQARHRQVFFIVPLDFTLHFVQGALEINPTRGENAVQNSSSQRQTDLSDSSWAENRWHCVIFSQVDLVLLSNGLIHLEFPEIFEDNSKTIRQNMLQQGFPNGHVALSTLHRNEKGSSLTSLIYFIFFFSVCRNDLGLEIK